MSNQKTFLPNAPTKNLWIGALLIGFLGILSHFVPMGELSLYGYWLLLIGFFMLVVGTSYKGM